MLSESCWKLDPSEKQSAELYFRLISSPALYMMRFTGVCVDTGRTWEEAKQGGGSRAFSASELDWWHTELTLG